MAKKVTLATFYSEWQNRITLYTPKERMGQSAYNTFVNLCPEIRHLIMYGSQLDPSYVDERLPLFLVWLHTKLR